MHHFQFKKNRLYAEGVPVDEIADQVGTPLLPLQPGNLGTPFYDL